MTYEQAIDRYMNFTTDNNKSISQATIDIMSFNVALMQRGY